MHRAVLNINSMFKAWNNSFSEERRLQREHERVMQQKRLDSQLELNRLEIRYEAEKHERQREHNLAMQKLTLQITQVDVSAAALLPPSSALPVPVTAVDTIYAVEDINPSTSQPAKLQGYEDFDERHRICQSPDIS